MLSLNFDVQKLIMSTVSIAYRNLQSQSMMLGMFLTYVHCGSIYRVVTKGSKGLISMRYSSRSQKELKILFN